MLELKNSKTTYLGRANGRNRFACDCHIGAIQMREKGKDWEDIKPHLVRDIDGLHVEGAPYAVKITGDGDRRIYPDRTDLSKWIYLPVPNFIKSLPKRIEGNKIIASAPKFDIIFQFTNTGIQFMVLIKEPIAFDRVTFDVDSVGFDFLKLLKTKTGLGIPRPRLIEVGAPLPEAKERWLDWSFKDGQLELGFDLTELKFPILLKNTTIDEQVGASADDVMEWGLSGIQPITDANIYVYPRVDQANDNYRCGGARFQTVDVPQGATIDDGTYLSVNVLSTDYDDPSLDIYAEDVDDAVNFTDDPNVISRVRTTAGVSWLATGIGAGWKNSPELKTVIKEIVDRLAWLPDQDMVMLLIGKAVAYTPFIFSAWDTAGNVSGPKLRIEYTSGAAHEKNLSDSVAISDSLSKAFGGFKADSVALADAVGKAPELAKADSVILADALTKTVELFKADSIALADSISKAPSPNKSDSVAIADAISKTVGLVKVEAVAIADSIAKTISTVKADVVAIADSFATDWAVVAHVLNLVDRVIITDVLAGVICVKTYIGVAVSRMSAARVRISRMPLFRFICRRFP